MVVADQPMAAAVVTAHTAGMSNLTYDLLKEEFTQRRSEGCLIPQHLEARFLALEPALHSDDQARLRPIYHDLMEVPQDAALAEREPNGLEAIRALRPKGPRDLGWNPDQDTLVERLHGAWMGRSIGCILGKPVEGMGSGWDWWAAGRTGVGRLRIKRHLQETGDWPLSDYIVANPGFPEMVQSQSVRGRITFVEDDDDLRYTCVALAVLEEHGPDFTWRQVADTWVSRLAGNGLCTAERRAYDNYTAGDLAANGPSGSDFTSTRFNPYREWIGAQIRSDGYAWAAAGRPALAAEFAWRDAHWTHRRNGIYGAMMWAAIQAAAAVEREPQRLLDIGLAEIPRDCRLAVVIRQVLDWHAQVQDWETLMERIEAAWPMNPVHTINNAAICAVALLCGGTDVRAATTIAVMCGLDTDCNGATIGSVAGLAVGRSGCDERLAAPFNDTFRTTVQGFADGVLLRDLAVRHAAVWRTVDSWQRTH